MDDKLFDQIADAELHALERVLGELDPDDVEVELASGVLKLGLRRGEVVVINSHRAARQIRMAAHTAELRKAWHFSPEDAGGGAWRWRTGDDELRATLAALLSQKLGATVSL